jgi:phosphomannomutase
MTEPRAPAPTFLGYAPVSLGFGTSGLRGLVKDITDLEAYVNVKAALRYLLAAGDVASRSTVVLAGDLRPSSERIMAAAARAIVDCGCAVENSGKIPTPAVILHAMSARRAGVMVSGSHIPFDRNGIKLSKSTGEILKSDEAGITREVERVRAQEYGQTGAASRFGADGMLKDPHPLPAIDRGAEEAYVRRYVGAFPQGGLRGLRVLVYQHSAVGRDILARILRELGAEVIAAGRTETFVPIDTENITDDELGRMEALAQAAEAGGAPVDAIVSTDGDSDRPLVVAVLGARGKSRGSGSEGERRVKFLSGDLLGIVVAEYLSADAVAVPISANDAVERRMAERGVVLRKTRIGSPYVIAAIDELVRTGKYRQVVGWEANGGFLAGSDIVLPGGRMVALPTRDGVLPILATLYAAADDKVDLAALWSRLPARFGRAGLLDEIPVAVGRAVLTALSPPSPPAGATELDLREADAGLKATIARLFTPALGFGDAIKINVLDGVRIYFANGDVAHVRPSGNAPQLRIYANSDTQARADQIVELALREPDGILRQLMRLVGA